MDFCVRLTLLGLMLWLPIYATDDSMISWEDLVDEYENDLLFFADVERNYPICEYESEDLVITNKTCDIRNVVLPELSFKWRASWYCFGYLQPSLRNNSATPVQPGSCVFRNAMLVPCLYINSTTSDEQFCYQVDEEIPEIVNEIGRTLLSNVGIRKWTECSKSAVACCENVLADSVPENDTCAPTWDAWSCWDKAPVGESSIGICPEHAYSNTGPSCHHFSDKECLENGTWNIQSNYNTCSVTGRLITRTTFHIVCLSISLVIAFPAVVLLFAYKKLRVRRLALHRNLLIAIMARNFFVILSKSIIVMEELTSSATITTMSQNAWPCKILSIMDKLAASATFTCMLIDGFFLHRMIVAVFKKELNIVLVNSIGAAATVIPVLIWTILMATENNSSCWMVYTVPNIQWVLDAPRLIMLSMNVCLLINILRVLLTKLRRSENAHNLSTAKATLFLMPLFGVQFLITAWRPKTTSCDWEQIYYFFTYIMDGLQGIMVAVLYCYLNKEVHILLTITYKKTENVVSTRFRSEVRGRRATMNNINNRRETFTTMVDNQQRPSNAPYAVEIQHQEDSNGNFKKFSTFRSSFTDSGINENDEDLVEIPQVDGQSVNSIVLLKNPYKSSRDGIVNMEFENDIYEPSYDKLRRFSEERNSSVDPNSEEYIEMKPRIPRSYHKSESEYQNFEIIVCNKNKNDENANVKGNQNNSPTSNEACARQTRFENDDFKDEVIFLRRPLHKNENSTVLPDLCSDINIDALRDYDDVNYNYHTDEINKYNIDKKVKLNDEDCMDGINKMTSNEDMWDARYENIGGANEKRSNIEIDEDICNMIRKNIDKNENYKLNETTDEGAFNPGILGNSGCLNVPAQKHSDLFNDYDKVQMNVNELTEKHSDQFNDYDKLQRNSIATAEKHSNQFNDHKNLQVNRIEPAKNHINFHDNLQAVEVDPVQSDRSNDYDNLQMNEIIPQVNYSVPFNDCDNSHVNEMEPVLKHPDRFNDFNNLQVNDIEPSQNSLDRINDYENLQVNIGPAQKHSEQFNTYDIPQTNAFEPEQIESDQFNDYDNVHKHLVQLNDNDLQVKTIESAEKHSDQLTDYESQANAIGPIQKYPIEPAHKKPFDDYDSLEFSPELKELKEFENLGDLNGLEIFEEIKKKHDDHIYENLRVQDKPDEQRESAKSGIYEDIIFDPSKLCPNRTEEEDIIFV